ncbi:hypothetical protein EI555_002942, partial [Monodon monoceros]
SRKARFRGAQTDAQSGWSSLLLTPSTSASGWRILTGTNYLAVQSRVIQKLMRTFRSNVVEDRREKRLKSRGVAVLERSNNFFQEKAKKREEIWVLSRPSFKTVCGGVLSVQKAE